MGVSLDPHVLRSEALEAVLNTAASAVADPFAYLNSLAVDGGRKVVGCVALNVPEEILFAAGLHPALLPDSEEPITVGSTRLQAFFCGYMRSIVDVAMKGKLDFLDGVVMHDCCHPVRAAHGILERNAPQIRWQDCLWFPPILDKPQTKPFVIKELRDFKGRVETHVGHDISDSALWESIRLYNRHRRLLKHVYAIRRSKPGLFSASQFVRLVQAGTLMPREEHCALLSRLIGEAQAAPPVPVKGARIVLSGSLCDPPQDEILEMLDKVGAVIVDDDLWTGSRYFATEVPEVGDPIEALADAYVHMVPVCPTRHRSDKDLGDYLLEMVRESKAEGVLFLIVKFCEPHYYSYPLAKKKLQDAGVPELLIETEHEMVSLGQIETRLQAFVEAIQGSK